MPSIAEREDAAKVLSILGLRGYARLKERVDRADAGTDLPPGAELVVETMVEIARRRGREIE